MKKMFLQLALLSSLFLIMPPAKADPACPRALSPNLKDDKEISLKSDAPIIVYYKNEYYKIPNGYYVGSTTKEIQKKSEAPESNIIIPEGTFYITFWMPSLRHSRKNFDVPNMNYKTCIDGRPVRRSSNEEEYLVQIMMRDLDINAKGELVTPEVMYKNYTISESEEDIYIESLKNMDC